MRNGALNANSLALHNLLILLDISSPDYGKTALNSLDFSYRKEISGAVLDGASTSAAKRLLFTSRRGVWRRGERRVARGSTG